MNIFTKIRNWFKPDPDTIVQVLTTDNEGKTVSDLMTMEQADDISEAFFKKRWFGTEKENEKTKDPNRMALIEERKTIAARTNKVAGKLNLNLKLVDKPSEK